MPARVDRREKLEARLDYLNASYSYFPTLNKDSELVTAYRRAFGIHDSNHYSPGATAVKIAHRQMVEDMIQNDYASILVLEDDCDFELDIGARLPAILEDIDPTWDLLCMPCLP